jgi:hypothetical protein
MAKPKTVSRVLAGCCHSGWCHGFQDGVRTHGSERRLESRVGGLECGSVDVVSPFVSAWWLKGVCPAGETIRASCTPNASLPPQKTPCFADSATTSNHITRMGGATADGHPIGSAGRPTTQSLESRREGGPESVPHETDALARSTLARSPRTSHGFPSAREDTGEAEYMRASALLTRQGFLVAKVGCGNRLADLLGGGQLLASRTDYLPRWDEPGHVAPAHGFHAPRRSAFGCRHEWR